MKKKNVGMTAVLTVLMLLLAGCGAKSASYDTASMKSASYASDEAYDTAAASDYEADDYEVAEEDVKLDSGAGVAGETRAETSGRKLIKRQYVTMETKKFDELTQFIQETVNAVGGYIEYSDISGSSYNYNGTRYADYTLRIPVTELDGFVVSLKEAGNVTNFSESVEDITLSYVDTESRISALETERETLMEMLDQAGDLDTLLAIQSRLTEVRYQLESYQSQLRVYNNDIEYSTVSVNVREVERETKVEDNSFGSQLKERLSSNFYGLGQGLKSAALFLLGGIPYWIVLAVVIAAVVLIVKRIRRRSAAKRDAFVRNIPAEYPADDDSGTEQKNEK